MIDDLQVYDILDIQAQTVSVNWLMQKAGGSWGGHIAPVVSKDGRLGTGDTHAKGSEWNPLKQLEGHIDEGEIKVRVYRPRGYTADELMQASEWWLANVEGTTYDYWAFVGLTIKVALWDKWRLDTGHESRWYCVEGAMDGLRYGVGTALMEGEIYTVRALERFARRSKELDLVGEM